MNKKSELHMSGQPGNLGWIEKNPCFVRGRPLLRNNIVGLPTEELEQVTRTIRRKNYISNDRNVERKLLTAAFS